MSLRTEILGKPGEDNAVLVTVDSGQSTNHLLLDCGEDCLNQVRPSVIQSVDHLCFSHFHMDHVCGFDSFFRRNYNRPDLPVHVWGPPGTLDVMANRFRSFVWNLHGNQPGEWIVHEVFEGSIEAGRFFTREAFARLHPLATAPHSHTLVFEERSFQIECLLLPHHTIFSAAYRISEPPRKNVCQEALRKSGLSPGAWLQSLNDPSASNDCKLEVNGQSLRLGDLRRDLLITSPGESLAYLTDYRLVAETEEWDAAVSWLSGTDRLISECQYLNRDLPLAARHGHMTASEVGRLAKEAAVGSLTLTHVSRRYDRAEWRKMEEEARALFASTSFPPEWSL